MGHRRNFVGGFFVGRHALRLEKDSVDGSPAVFFDEIRQASCATELSPKGLLALQDCGVILRVAIHDTERRATMRLCRTKVLLAV